MRHPRCVYVYNKKWVLQVTESNTTKHLLGIIYLFIIYLFIYLT